MEENDVSGNKRNQKIIWNRRQPRKCVERLDLNMEKGEFCVLLGPSGSGKSTLLNIIGGIDGADEGSITIEGERLEDMTEKKLSMYRRKHLGYIFQMYNLIPNLTVRENIEVGAYLSEQPLDVDELLHTLGLTNIRENCRISYPEDSSRELRSDVRSSRIRIFCCVMSRPVRWIIIHQRKF